MAEAWRRRVEALLAQIAPEQERSDASLAREATAGQEVRAHRLSADRCPASAPPKQRSLRTPPQASAAAGRLPAAARKWQRRNSGVVLSDEVAAALDTERPVVALESTIISHGMPFPQNLETAQQVEAVVRAHGAVPATIAILGGVPHVGLTPAQLERLARAGPAVRKASRRDLPAVMALGLDGATTVSATMLLAARAGIAVFVTGGIGGVHRGGEATMDVSADLTELGRTAVAVVCAGAKSVLDIPRTLEYLETQARRWGVCVAAYGADEFPAFFTRHSGCRAPCRADTPEQAAAMVDAALRLRLGSGLVLGVPIPEQHATTGREVEAAISTALAEAEAKGVKGNDVTPFLLQRIRELTGGRSLEANIALVKNNAAVGARVAAELSSLRRQRGG
eukprot:scaffold3.g6732.t1